jgi:NADH:ubiquinone oxidoreductase subunit K
VAELLAYVRAITLGSLTGNTADAFFDRFRGAQRSQRDVRGNVVFEAVVAIAAAPVLVVLAALAKLDRRAGIKELRSR